MDARERYLEGQAIQEAYDKGFKAGYDQAVADSVDQLKLMFKAGIKEETKCQLLIEKLKEG